MRAEEDPHKAPFTAAHIQPLGNTCPLRTALPVCTVLSENALSMCLCVHACTWVHMHRGGGANQGSWDMRAGRGGVKLSLTTVMFFSTGGEV